MNLISSLVRDKKYIDILNLVREGKVSLWDRVIFNQIIKLFVYHNDPHINKILIEQYPHDIAKDMDGRMPFHVIYEQGNEELIKRYISKYPNYIEAVNLKENTTLINSIISLNDTKMLNFAFKVNPHININRHTSTLGSYLLNSIRINKNGINSNDPSSYEMVKILLDKGADPNILLPMSCFSFIARNIMNCGEIIQLLLKYGADINLVISPSLFILSHINSNHTFLKIIFDLKYNYIFTIWDIIYCIKSKNVDIKTIITIINKIDQIDIHTFRDKDLNSILMYALINDADPEIISHLLLKVDINSPNYKGETPIHILFKKGTYVNYSKILENTFIDIFKECANKNTPISYISDKDIPIVIDLFIKGYTNYHNINKLKLDLNCIKEIRTLAFNNEICNPKLIKIKSLELEKSNNYVASISSITKFIDNLIFSYKLLSKYKDLITIPSIDSNNIDIANNMIFQEISYVSSNSILRELVTESKGLLFKKYIPSLIIFSNNTIDFYYPTIVFYIMKEFKLGKRYILLNIVNSYNSFMINALYDKENNIIEFYTLDNYQSNSVDFIKTFIKDIFEKVTEKKIYIRMINISISSIIKKITPISGFSLAKASHMINLLFIEYRLLNPNISLDSLVREYLNKISDIDDKQYAEKLFEHFRLYFEDLAKYKHSIYKSAGISESNFYSRYLTDAEKTNINKIIES